MSRFAWLASMAVCGLALAAVSISADETLTEQQKATNRLKALGAKIKLDQSDVTGRTVAEVLRALGKEHGVEFVIREEEFRAAGVNNIKDRKSFLSTIDTKDLTVPQFLDVWLASVGATYKLEPGSFAVVPAPRWNEKAGELDRTDRAAVALAVLDSEINFRADLNIDEVTLFELVSHFSKRYDQTFTVNEEAFKRAGRPNIKEDRPNVAAPALRGLTVRQFLNVVLDKMGATYLLKNGTIEIVPVKYAARATGSALRESDGEDGAVQLKEPLVSAVFKEKPLSEVVAKIAETYDLTVVVSPQAGDAKAGFVTARLLNVPADKALELLADQCDLRVVRRGAAFLLTSKDHANALFEERTDRERQKIELEKLRTAPAKPPVPPAPEKSLVIPPQTVPTIPG